MVKAAVSEGRETVLYSFIYLGFNVCLCVQACGKSSMSIIFLTPHFPDVAPPVERCQGAGPCTMKGSGSLEESRNNPHQSRQLKTPTSVTPPDSEQRPLLGNHT